ARHEIWLFPVESVLPCPPGGNGSPPALRKHRFFLLDFSNATFSCHSRPVLPRVWLSRDCATVHDPARRSFRGITDQMATSSDSCGDIVVAGQPRTGNQGRQ